MDHKESVCIVYTGNGKGKTTAAFGLCMRAAGHGKRCLVVQFMKGPGNEYGEASLAAARIPEIQVVRFGRDEFVSKEQPAAEDVRLAQDGVAFALDAAISGKYDLIVLDEINVAVDYGLVDVQRVLQIIRERHPHTNLVLTGRNARDEICEASDTVTEMKLVKHHYYAGVPALECIEY
ncbi:MAG TPA: cob(I)yrinic acid a,c-diamide adenosyltransferase [Firmicutes bacterium]|nr:cob(I)yrinic acid a,c-diamide adenosyltransferase [Bacillota bacterium]